MRSLPRATTVLALLALSTTAAAQQPEPPAPGAQPATPETPPADQEPKPADDAKPEPKPGAAAAAPEQPPAKQEAAPQGPLAGVGGAEVPPAEGFRERIRFRAGMVTLVPIVLVQTQVSPYAGEDSFHQAGDIAERPGFRLRRARVGLGGNLHDEVRFAVSAQLGSEDDGSLLIHDAWGGYVFCPCAQVYAGARDVPFSRSAMTGAGDGALIERPLAVRAMAPFTQVGIQAEGNLADGAFKYYAGVYNGFQRSDQFYEGHSESYAPLGNRFEGVALVGRVATEPLGPLGRTIQDVDHSPPRIGAGAGYYFSKGGARTLHGAGGDFLLHASGLHALLEVLFLNASPESVPTQPITQVSSISSVGIVGEAGYMILRRKLGVSARVEWIDPNPDTDNEGDNVVITGGVSYHAFEDILKAQLDYTHREELHGLSLANDALTLQLQLSL